MLTAIFFEEFVSGRDWKIINMDDGRHSVVITDRKDGSDGAISLQYENGTWKLQEINEGQVLLNGAEVRDAVRIRIDDCIEIGDTKFYFEGSGLVYGYPTQGSGLSINID